jgi:transcription factor IIIB 90 kDa subunit
MSSSRLMGRHIDNRDSRETTLMNARRILSQIASSVRLPTIFVDRAYRLYQLALQRNYNIGRRQTHILATCLYIICRQEKSPHLLIDFSDALQVNVYLLGKTFLNFMKIVNIPLEVIDPSLYIHRYADKLDFGDKMSSVITTSLRIITRLKKDWIVTGRRPDGVCAAALLIAARAHEFQITQETIASLFRIATDTVRKRILEFRVTPAAQLTLQQFFTINLEDETIIEYDPPAYIRNTLLDAAEQSNVHIALQLQEEEEIATYLPPLLQPTDLEKDDIYKNILDDDDDDDDNIDHNILDNVHNNNLEGNEKTIKTHQNNNNHNSKYSNYNNNNFQLAEEEEEDDDDDNYQIKRQKTNNNNNNNNNNNSNNAISSTANGFGVQSSQSMNIGGIDILVPIPNIHRTK